MIYNSNMTIDKFVIEGPPDEPLPDTNSYGQIVLDNLEKYGNAIAQISSATGEIRTYESIRRKVIQLGIGLKKLGIQKGDVIAIFSENRFEFTICALAIIVIGATNTTANTIYSRNELIHTLNISKPKLIFCSPTLTQNIINILNDVKSLKTVITFGNKKSDNSVLFYDDLFNENENISNFKATDVDIATHPVAILCSSGTTGLPKGVVLTHKNFIICDQHLRDMLKEFTGPENCLLLLLPWFHAYGFITHLAALNLYVKYVFMTKFEEEEFLNSVQNYKVSITMLVPPLLVFLAKNPMVDNYNLTSLRQILCGAAPLSKEVQIAVTKRIGVKDIRQAYGMTETTLAVLRNRITTPVYGSCGQVENGTKIKVVDIDTGKSLGPFIDGELCFKGPMMMYGYMGDIASTEHIFDSDGWLHTGDVGYYDNDKYFYIVDRIKELIKYKAFQVAPAELEALLLRHSDVKDAAVIGLPDEIAGELPLAFIVKQPDSNVTEKDIIDFVARQVSYHKRLHGGVRFLEDIPKNPSGKILRRILRDKIKDQRDTKIKHSKSKL